MLRSSAEGLGIRLCIGFAGVEEEENIRSEPVCIPGLNAQFKCK